MKRGPRVVKASDAALFTRQSISPAHSVPTCLFWVPEIWKRLTVLYRITWISDNNTLPGEDEPLMHPTVASSPSRSPPTSRPHSPLTIRSRRSGNGSGDGFQSLGEVLSRQ